MNLSSFGVGRGFTFFTVKDLHFTKCNTGLLTWKRSLVNTGNVRQGFWLGRRLL